MLKTGEYLLHIYIEMTQGLSNWSNPDDLMNPIIQVKACNEVKYTKKLSNKGNSDVQWNEHFYFQQTYDNSENLEKQNIFFKVLNHHLFGSEAELAELIVDFLTIYQAENHAIQYQWYALSMPSKPNQSAGFMKLSMNLYHQSDKPVELQAEPYNPKNIKMGEVVVHDVIYPSSMSTTTYQIQISLIRAENLPKLDMIGSIDPFVTATINEYNIRTVKISNNQNPVWNVGLLLPYSEPSISDELTIRLFDYEFGTKDQLLGIIPISIKDVKNKKYVTNTWFNLYGADKDLTDDQKALVCSHSALTNTWSGRILMAIDIQTKENPVQNRCQIKIDNVNTPVTAYQVQFDIAFAVDLPDQKCKIKIKWGEFEQQTSDTKPTNGCGEFYQRIQINDVKFPYRNTQEMPDFFIFIILDNKTEYFTRLAPGKYLNQDSSNLESTYFQTYLPDKETDFKPQLYFTLTFGQQLKQITPLSRPQTNTNLILDVYQAQHLSPAEQDGINNPQIVISAYNQRTSTIVQKETNNPVINKRIQINYPVFVTQFFCPLIIKVYDVQDKDKQNYIGEAVVDLNSNKDKINNQLSTMATAQWYDLVAGTKQIKVGTISLGINIIPGQLQNIQTDINLKCENYKFYVNFIGFRGLKSRGTLPIKRPFLKADLNGIRQPQDRQTVQQKSTLITMAKEVGPNANINSIIEFNINLPVDIQQIPNLQCLVYDKGFTTTEVGVFEMRLREIADQTNLYLSNKIKEIKAQQALQLQQLNSQSQNNQQSLPNPVQQPVPVQQPIVIYAKYSADLDKNEIKEINIPDSNKYLPVGYDPHDLKFKLLSIQPTLEAQQYIQSQQAASNIKQSNTVTQALQDNKAQTSIPVVTDVNKQSIKKPPTKAAGKSLSSANAKDAIVPIKHYRQFYITELEQTDILNTSLHKFQIRSGCILRKKSNSFLSSFLTHDTSDHEVGIAKAFVSIYSKTAQQQVEQLNQLQPSWEEKLKQYQLQMSQKQQVIVRLYIFNAFSLKPKDDENQADPYLLISLGNQVFNQKHKYKEDNSDPDFYELFEFSTTLPGDSLLNIQVMDHSFFHDTLIGQSVIDLEDRYFCQKWQDLENIPVETRQLYHPSSALSQGSMRLFLEIINAKEVSKLKQKWQIQPKPQIEYEMRVIIWDIFDCPSGSGGISDYYVICNFGGEKQHTDTHYRSQNGKGNFNWRCVFKIKLPSAITELNFQVFDKDFFSPDDYISAADFNFADLAQDAFDNENTQKAYSDVEPEDDNILSGKSFELSKMIGGKKQYEKIELIAKNYPKKNAKECKEAGKMVISFELVPITIAATSKVGLGRSEPNVNPKLPEPLGRIHFSWNPYTMFEELLGPKARNIVCILLFSGTLIYLLYLTMPATFGSFIAKYT